MKSVYFLLLAAVMVPTMGASTTPDASKISPELIAQMEREDEKVSAGEAPRIYRVVIELQPNTAQGHKGMDRAFATPEAHEALMNDIAKVQNGVLRSMSAKGHNSHIFEIWNRYQSTYGFSAYVDSAAIRTLASHAEVTFVQEMPIYAKMDAQAHSLTNTDIAHNGGTTGDGVTIAIIDDGIDADHAAFGGSSAWPNAKILGGWDFADNDSDPRTDCMAQSHGTAVAGVAAGNGGGVAGSAPDARIVFLKVQSASLCGQDAFDGDIPAAIDWAVTNRNNFTPAIKIISISLGTCATYSNPCSSIAESSALAAARSAGMVTLVGSGNSAASNGISSPACHPDAVSVGAVYDANVGGRGFNICNDGNCRDASTTADRITCYSNSDSFLDILAPSDCTRTAHVGGGQNLCFAGTSSATAYAAGVTALIFETNPSISRNAAIMALEAGIDITDSRNGVTVPRVDAAASISAASDDGDPGEGSYCGGSINGVSISGCDSSGMGYLECVATAFGGSGQYNYWWMYEGPGQLYQTNSSTASITGCFGGQGTLSVQVLDRTTMDTCVSPPFTVSCGCSPLGEGDLCDDSDELPF